MNETTLDKLIVTKSNTIMEYGYYLKKNSIKNQLRSHSRRQERIQENWPRWELPATEQSIIRSRGTWFIACHEWVRLHRLKFVRGSELFDHSISSVLNVRRSVMRRKNTKFAASAKQLINNIQFKWT